MPKLRCALNNTVHATTGQTPFKLFMSRCEEATMPIDLILGKEIEREFLPCHLEYLVEQQRILQSIMEAVCEETRMKMKVQATGVEQGGLKIRTYKRGDLVWRLCPPMERSKLASKVWRGPYKVLDASGVNNVVKLCVPAPGRGTRKVLKWINTSNVKPVEYTKEGRMLNLNVRWRVHNVRQRRRRSDNIRRDGITKARWATKASKMIGQVRDQVEQDQIVYHNQAWVLDTIGKEVRGVCTAPAAHYSHARERPPRSPGDPPDDLEVYVNWPSQSTVYSMPRVEKQENDEVMVEKRAWGGALTPGHYPIAVYQPGRWGYEMAGADTHPPSVMVAVQ